MWNWRVICVTVHLHTPHIDYNDQSIKNFKIIAVKLKFLYILIAFWELFITYPDM